MFFKFESFSINVLFVKIIKFSFSSNDYDKISIFDSKLWIRFVFVKFYYYKLLIYSCNYWIVTLLSWILV